MKTNIAKIAIIRARDPNINRHNLNFLFRFVLRFGTHYSQSKQCISKNLTPRVLGTSFACLTRAERDKIPLDLVQADAERQPDQRRHDNVGGGDVEGEFASPDFEPSLLLFVVIHPQL